MLRHQKYCLKPMFKNNSYEAIIFLGLVSDLDDDYYQIAKFVFIDGLSAKDIAVKVSYSKRQVERIRVYIMRLALKRAVERINKLL